MVLKRTLILDENDLVMVVKEDVIKQIDENRGEMNRTEFVNYLIQYQLKERDPQHGYVTRDEFQEFTREIKELLHNFLQFCVSCGMLLNNPPSHGDLESLNHQMECLDNSDEEAEGH